MGGIFINIFMLPLSQWNIFKTLIFMRTILRIAGVLACIAVFVLNLQNAADNYGIREKLHLIVLAQSGGSGSGFWDICYTDPFYDDLIMQKCENTGQMEVLRVTLRFNCHKGSVGSCKVGFVYLYYTCSGTEFTDDYSSSGDCGGYVIVK